MSSSIITSSIVQRKINLAITASYALSASYAPGGGGTGGLWTASVAGPISRQGNVQISGSLDVNDNIIGSLLGTASYSETASLLLGSIESASYATSASYAISASYAPGSGGGSGTTFSTVNNLQELTALTASTSDVGYVTESSRYYLYAGDVWKDISTIPMWGNLYNEAARYDAGELVGLADADNIGSWSDFSGNHLLLVANTTGPVYKTGIVNSLPISRWSNASSEWMKIPKEFGNMASSKLTVIAVVNENVGALAAIISMRSSTGTTGWTLRFDNSTTLRYFHTATTPDISHTVTGSAWNIIFLKRDGFSASIGDIYSSGSVIGAGYNISADTFTQIGTENGGTSNYYDGDLAEIIILDRYVTGSEFNTIINDLKTKYNIT